MPVPAQSKQPLIAERIGLIAKPRSEPGAKLVPELIRWLRTRGLSIKMDHECAAYAGMSEGYSRDVLAAESDLLIVLGGDGTLLSTARSSIGRDIPVFAVNLGGLGFLTAIKIDDLYTQLERTLKGDYFTVRRRMLHAQLWRDGLRIAEWEALNDAVLTKTEIARMIQLEVHVDDHLMCVYRADGLIVSTPTGSTAYSLSAGGPIMFPTVAALAITPICPHMLTNRPVILPDDSVIRLTTGEGPATYLTIDGQVGEMLHAGDQVICKRSEHFLTLVRPPDTLFFDVLREKLRWGGQ